MAEPGFGEAFMDATDGDITVSAINISNLSSNLSGVIVKDVGTDLEIDLPVVVTEASAGYAILFFVTVSSYAGPGDPWGFDVEIVHDGLNSPKTFRFEGTLGDAPV